MESLTIDETNIEAGTNWYAFGGGAIVGVATIAVDIFAPELSPIVTKIGATVASGLIVYGATH